MMCHIRTQNTNKMLRAICQRQKAMVRAYLSMRNEMTLALQKINIFGYWPFPVPSPFTFLKISPSSSKVFVPFFFFFQSKSEKIIYSLAIYCLYLVLIFSCVFVLFFFHCTLSACLLDIGHSKMGSQLIRQGLILLQCLPLFPLLLLP